MERVGGGAAPRAGETSEGDGGVGGGETAAPAGATPRAAALLHGRTAQRWTDGAAPRHCCTGRLHVRAAARLHGGRRTEEVAYIPGKN